MGRPITEQPTGRLRIRATSAAYAGEQKVRSWERERGGCKQAREYGSRVPGGGALQSVEDLPEFHGALGATAPRARLHMYGILPLFTARNILPTSRCCSSLLLAVPIGSIRSLVFCNQLAGGDWKKVEAVLLLCSAVFPCSLILLCACVVLCVSDYCPPWPGVWAPCCAVFIFSGWCGGRLPRFRQRL